MLLEMFIFMLLFFVKLNLGIGLFNNAAEYFYFVICLFTGWSKNFLPNVYADSTFKINSTR